MGRRGVAKRRTPPQVCRRRGVANRRTPPAVQPAVQPAAVQHCQLTRRTPSSTLRPSSLRTRRSVSGQSARTLLTGQTQRSQPPTHHLTRVFMPEGVGRKSRSRMTPSSSSPSARSLALPASAGIVHTPRMCTADLGPHQEQYHCLQNGFRLENLELGSTCRKARVPDQIRQTIRRSGTTVVLRAVD